MFQDLRFPILFDSRFEIADKTISGLNVGIHMDVDFLIGLDRLNQFGQILLDVLAAPGFMELSRLSAEVFTFFHEIGVIALLSQHFCRSHACQPPPDHQRRLVNLQLRFYQRLVQRHFGHSHSGQVLSFLCCFFRIKIMHPGTLVSNIGHFKQIFIHPGIDHCFLEKWFMGFGRAGRHYQAV